MNRQLSLFEDENRSIAHLAGFTAMIRAAMNRAAAASPWSRAEIVDRMNRLILLSGKRVTQGIRMFLSSLRMDGRAVNMAKVADLARTYPQVAQETIRGTRNHRRVLSVLEELGCPQEYLYGENGATAGRAA